MAQRLRIRPWRDPRMLIGVMLVLGATLLGARVAASADHTVEYWTVSSAAVPGDPVTEESLEATRAHIDGAAADQYVRTDETFEAPLEDLVWAHDMPAGALVEKSALVSRARVDRHELPLSVADGAAPADLRHGDLVDVWVGPGPGDEPGRPAARVLERVRVLDSGDEAAAIGGSGAQTVLVDVDADQLTESVISTAAAGHVTLVRIS